MNLNNYYSNETSYFKVYRKNKKLTQKEMAKLLYVCTNTYISYEQGKRKIPNDVLIRFLELRNDKYDDKIIDCLKRVYGDKK